MIYVPLDLIFTEKFYPQFDVGGVGEERERDLVIIWWLF